MDDAGFLLMQHAQSAMKLVGVNANAALQQCD